MIAFLRGRLAEALPHRATIDVNGVGYLVLIPLTTFDKLPHPGEEVQLLTHYHVTDRDHTLFGFITSDERDLFRLLMDRVSGIGPKMALSVLSGMPVAVAVRPAPSAENTYADGAGLVNARVTLQDAP